MNGLGMTSIFRGGGGAVRGGCDIELGPGSEADDPAQAAASEVLERPELRLPDRE